MILSKFRQGKFQVRVQHEHLETLTKTLDKSSNRISFALIIAGLLIGSSMLVAQSTWLQSSGMAGYGDRRDIGRLALHLHHPRRQTVDRWPYARKRTRENRWRCQGRRPWRWSCAQGIPRRKEAVQGRSSMGRFHPGDGPPNAIFRVWEPLPAVGTHVPCRGARGGSWPERFPTGHGRKASPLVQRRRSASFINSWLRPPMGGLEIFPPMNRRNPASGRMARCYGSRCGTRGSDYPLNRLCSSHPVTLQPLRRSRDLPVPGGSRPSRTEFGPSRRQRIEFERIPEKVPDTVALPRGQIRVAACLGSPDDGRL